MQFRSPELFQKLETLASHYKSNVASPHLKAELPALSLTQRDWDEVELITARQEIFRHQGYHLDELYVKLLALARLVNHARTQLAPVLRARVSGRNANRSGTEKLMADMAVANFLPNLEVLARMVKELYELTRQEDAAQNQGKHRALASVPEAKEIPALLGL